MERREIVYFMVTVMLSLMFIGAHIGPIIPVTFSLAVGSSMFPSITNGDMLICVSRYIAPIKPGDIAVYKHGGEFVVHRVLSVDNDHAIFKGDNNILTDGLIPLRDVYFKVVFVIPSYVWVPVFATGLSFYGVFLILRRKKYEEKPETENAEVYSLSAIIYFIGISAIIILLAVNTISTAPLYTVKPNPLPMISNFSLHKNLLLVYFDSPLPKGNTTCTGMIDRITTPLNCIREKNVVKIDISPLEKYCKEQEICVIQVIIHHRIDSPYNVVVQYPVSTTIKR